MKKLFLLGFLSFNYAQANVIEQFARENLSVSQTDIEVSFIKEDAKRSAFSAAIPSFFVGGVAGFLRKKSFGEAAGAGLLSSLVGYILFERVYWWFNKDRALTNEKLAHLLLQANTYDKKILPLIDKAKNTKEFSEAISMEYVTLRYPLIYVSDELISIISYIDTVHTLFVEILETHGNLDHSTEARFKAYCEKIDGSMPHIRKTLSGLKGTKEYKKEANLKRENDLKEAKILQVKEETLAAQARAQADKERARADAQLVEAHKANASKANAETTQTWLNIIFGPPKVKIDVTQR